MPLIQPKEKRERHPLSVQVDKEVYERLVRYAKFLKSDQRYVVEQALRLVLEKDKHFHQWEAEQEAPEKLRAVS